MADEVNIPDSPGRAKIRSPWAVALLPFVTLGIYHLVWWYRINRELRDYGDARGRDLGRHPLRSLLAVFPGFLLIVPPLVSYFRGAERIQSAAEMARTEPPNGWLCLVLYLVLPAAFSAYLQMSLNAVWRSEASRLPPQRPHPELGAKHQSDAQPEYRSRTKVILGPVR